MIQIQLTQGKVAIVDDEDAELARFKWQTHRGCHTYYGKRSVTHGDGRRSVEMLHKAVWARMHPGEPMPRELDHANGDGFDCRRANLRPVSKSENQQNARRRRNNTSGFMGVTRDRRLVSRPWRATIRVGGKRYSSYGFATAEDAARARDEAARKHFGTFATFNFPTSKS